MATSQNGWPVFTSAPSGHLAWVTGRVRPGDVQTIFDYLCKRFNAEVEPIRTDWSWGWAFRPVRGQSSGFSNHASGTAIDLNAPKHPIGTSPPSNYTTRQIAKIHAILRDLDGVVRWGGDYSGRKDGMHFEINANAAKVAEVARRIRAPKLDKGTGHAGTIGMDEPKRHAGTINVHAGDTRGEHPDAAIDELKATAKNADKAGATKKAKAARRIAQQIRNAFPWLKGGK